MVRSWVIFLLLVTRFTYTKCNCYRSNSIASNETSFFMVGMFPIHGEDIKGLNPNAVLWAEYFRYTVERLNKKYQERTMDLFGYEIYDTCSDEPTKAITSTAMDILLNNKGLKCDCLSKIVALYENIGIVGPHSSENALYFNSLLSYEQVAQVSYAATSIKLTGVQSFYRTVPSDLNQANFIKDLLLKLNWTYVITLATDDVYGRSGISVLSDVFKKSGICISISVTFNIRQNSSVESAIDTLTTLKEQNLSRVIIFWSLRETVESFMVKAGNRNLNPFVWIISEATGITNFFASSENQLSGTFLSVVLDNGRDEKFESYFNEYTYDDSIKTNNKYMRQLFHKYDINASLGDTSIKHLDLPFDFSHIGYVHDGIAALYEAFLLYEKSMIPCLLSFPPCTPFPIFDHKNFNQFLNKVSFKRLDGDTFTFDKNGESKTAKYNLYLTKKEQQGEIIVDFEKIVSWKSIDNKTSQISVTNSSLIVQLTNITSRCAEECRPGFYPIFDRMNTCCWVCLLCKKNYVKNSTGQYPCASCPHNTAPNRNKTQCLPLTELFLRWSNWQAVVLYIVSLLGVTLVLCIAILFKVYDNTPIVRCSNVVLSTIQLLAHLLIFLTPVLFIGTKDTINRCSARVYSTGLLLALVTCVSFVKVTHLLNVFNLKYKLTRREIIHQKTREMAVLLCFLLIDVCIAIGMLQTFPVRTVLTRDLESYRFFENCNINTHYLVQLAYLIIIQIACAIQSFRGRKLPGRFNEAQYTFFAMFTSTLLMAIGVPLAQSATNQKEENFVICIITITANLSILVILYGYKVGLILFYPEENTTEVFQRDRLEKAMNSSAARRLSRIPTTEFKINQGFTLNEYSETTDTNTVTNSSIVYDGPTERNSPSLSIAKPSYYCKGTVNPVFDGKE